MMSSSSSKSRNFRRRLDDEDSSPADAASAAVPSPSTARKPQPSSSSASKPKKLLSFADDEGDEDAITPLNHPSLSKSSSSSRRKPPPPSSGSGSSSSRLGRPSSAHKLTASRDRTPLSSPATTSNVLPQAGTYTREAILELKKNTRTLAKPSPKPSASSEPRIILRGLLKPAAPSPNQTLDTQLDDDDDDGEGEDVADANTRLASIGLRKSVSHDDYPDPETIRKIRAEREKKRQSRASAADFIPLNGPSHAGAEGSSDDEELEHRTRVAMVGKKESKSHGVFEDVDHVSMTTASGPAASARYIDAHTSANEIADEVDDEDEEDKIWEEEQFKKALGKRMDDGSATARVVSGGVGTNVAASTMQQPALQHRSSSAYPNIGGGLGGSQRLDVLTIQQQAEIAFKALQNNSRKLQESHDRTVSTLAKTDENLSASLDNITSLEVSLSAAGEKFIFMQRLRDFVSVLCEFLQHKAPFIEELEERIQKVQEKRAAAVLERRTADKDDEMVVDAAVKAAKSVFREFGNTAMMITAAASAAQTASASFKEQATQPELDELGRDMSRQKNMEMKRRAEARQRRKAKFDTKRFSCMDVDNSDQKIEGESSTDESESESEAYRSSRDMCLRTAGQILSDASEEYSQLQVVKERLENWKMKYAASYRDAYMSLSIPAIFSPYVRLELLHWDPLHKFADFIDMKWHSLLFNYGLAEGASDLNPGDADSNLVPQLIEKVAIPKLHHQIVHCWDTLSTLETENAVATTNLFLSYVPASSQAVVELLVAIRTRLADAVANITVPNWDSLVLKAVPSAAPVAAYRFGVSVRLIRNICLWKDVLALPILEELALDKLLRKKVLPHVQSISSDVHDAVARTERIVASLTGVWAGPDVTGDRSAKLQSVVDFVVSLGRTLEKKQAASGMSEGESTGLARRLKKLLVELNDYDNARGIARAFRLREAV
ncbi:Transcriptional repressor ILP1 [Linum grandiflorum]